MQRGGIVLNQQSFITGLTRTSSPGNFTPHFHQEYEILFVLSGSVKITVGGKEYVTGPRSLVFLNNLEEHALQILKEPYERFVLTLSSARADQILADPRFLSLFRARPAGFAHCFSVSAQYDAVLRIFETMHAERKAGLPLEELLCETLFLQLFILLFRCFPERFPQSARKSAAQFYAIQRYIDEHFTEPLTVEGLAGRFFLNKYYFSHHFKETTGYSPKEYLLLNRLSLARDLLLNTSLPVQEIAYRCGFADVNNFIRMFKRQYALTPGRYRGAT